MKATKTLLLWLCSAAALGWATPSRGAEPPLDWDPKSAAAQRFTAARWSMIYPDRNFEAGCVVGYRAFEFSPTGYFVFNSRIRGAWRVDELGNLKLRTRDGFRFSMVVDGTELRATRDMGFIRRTERYRLCPH